MYIYTCVKCEVNPRTLLHGVQNQSLADSIMVWYDDEGAAAGNARFQATTAPREMPHCI